MVAYSFKKRFVPLIESGAKAQTIRGDRTRHARVGEPIQLLYGMRTAHCRKIIEDPICSFVGLIRLDFLTGQVGIWSHTQKLLSHRFGNDLHKFAQADGFEDWADMRAFWEKNHPLQMFFAGTLIEWRPRHG